MARMFPAEISTYTQSSAEKLLFREFQRQLPDEYIVMHGVGWITRHRRWDENGEADFVIVHPRRGVLVLEVKGGRIEGQWASDKWISVDRMGNRHLIKNPVKQAERSMWHLKQKLEESPLTRVFAYTLSRGLALPDIVAGNAHFGVDFDRSMLIDSSDLRALEPAVERVFGKRGESAAFTADSLQALVNLIQPTVEIRRLGLAAEMQDGEIQIINLTEDQYQVLGVLQGHRQAVINGCAGSGKTMLAIEKAIRLAEQGFDVLLTCFNKNLSSWMRGVMAQQPPGIAARVRVNHYHDLAVQLCQEAGMPTTVRANDQRYWDEGLSEDLARATPHLATRFDAIVVDEGQDFAGSWWITLSDLLRDPEHGVFYIFQDERQALYERDSELPFAAIPFSLQTNCRSTSSIHRHVLDFYDGDPKPTSRGPSGREIEYLAPGNEPVRTTLRKAISKLAQEEGIQPHRIVVLTPNGEAKSVIKEGDRIGNLSLTWAVAPAPTEVRVSSIHSFKGLESDVVILAETERLATSHAANRLTYVALSRAKHHLVVIGKLPDA